MSNPADDTRVTAPYGTNAPVLRVALPGAAGKMGRAIVRVIADTPGLKLAAAVERPGHVELGQDAGVLAGVGPLNVELTDSLDAALASADVLIDFTAPAATAATAARAGEAAVAMVIGTTGLAADHLGAIERAAALIPIVRSPNMSVGVNVLWNLLAAAARALGPAYDVEIVELHHRQKRDAPSGTAMKMAEVLASALGRDLRDIASYGRHGDVGPRPPEQLGVMTVRGGDVIGDHTAYFLGLGDRLEITHRASSRDTFARGAIRAAQWLAGKAPGLYDMQDVLGLR
jgi:4-hydroxy-tetrahydrodipicolinate reductase